MDVLEQQLAQYPERGKRLDALDEFTVSYLAQREAARSLGFTLEAETVRIIPVYVHVLYQTAGQNIAAEQVESQITVLNQDYRRMLSTPGYGNGADTYIQFELAAVPAESTSGGTVDAYGINRKYVNKEEWGWDDDMKKSSAEGIDPVTPNTHLNIWVCNIGSGILGYAQFPGGSSDTDGVVIGPEFFGSSDIYPDGYYGAPYDKGRTTTHEVGHYLNLRHIWGDGDCSVDDFVVDTPRSDASNYGCPAGHMSCGSVDMIENYMDYTDDTCMDSYTQGQVDRMAACLVSTRASLGTDISLQGNGMKIAPIFMLLLNN